MKKSVSVSIAATVSGVQKLRETARGGGGGMGISEKTVKRRNERTTKAQSVNSTNQSAYQVLPCSISFSACSSLKPVWGKEAGAMTGSRGMYGWVLQSNYCAFTDSNLDSDLNTDSINYYPLSLQIVRKKRECVDFSLPTIILINPMIHYSLLWHLLIARKPPPPLIPQRIVGMRNVVEGRLQKTAN